MRDYLKLLRHLMQIHGKLQVQSMSFFLEQGYRTAGRPVPNAILKAETVHDIFIPSLPEKGVKSLSELLKTEGNSWSTALGVLATDYPGLRRKGSAGCKSQV